MKIPLYILGLLKRYGAMHGYQIKKIISEQIADFAQIKLPTIYYHLEKMHADGLLHATVEKGVSKKEKTVFSLTEKGRGEYHSMLQSVLDFHYRSEFVYDAAFYFLSSLSSDDVCQSLKNHIETMKQKIQIIQDREKEQSEELTDSAKINSSIIFKHHECHYKAELQWAQQSYELLQSQK